MKITKIISILLAVIIATAALASCANTGNGVNTRPAGDGGSADAGTFASGDFDNEDFTFLFIQQKAILLSF